MFQLSFGCLVELTRSRIVLLYVRFFTVHEVCVLTNLDGNEAEIGQVFKNTKVPRSEYFVTTKLYFLQNTHVTSHH